MPDLPEYKIAFEFIATRNEVRMIIWGLEDVDSRYYAVHDILESNLKEHSPHTVAKWMAKSWKDGAEVRLPDGLTLDPRITTPYTKIRKIIEHLIGYKPVTI